MLLVMNKNSFMAVVNRLKNFGQVMQMEHLILEFQMATRIETEII